MCKQNGPCVSWHHSSPLLRSTCTTPSCKWGTLFHPFYHVLLCSLSYCMSSSVLPYWQLVGVDRTNDFAATDFTQVVAAAIKPFPTTILEMGCITLTLQCCPNPRCPARLPLKLMGIPITCLSTTDWIKDHILALGKALRIYIVLYVFGIAKVNKHIVVNVGSKPTLLQIHHKLPI